MTMKSSGISFRPVIILGDPMSNNPASPVTASQIGAFVVVAVLIVLAIALLGSFHIVPPGHRGVSVTLGKVAPKELPEGLVFKLPLLTSITDVPVRQLRADGKADSFSSDLQTIVVSYTVLYRIPGGRVVELYQQYRGDPYLTLVEPRMQEGIKQIAALFRAEDLVKNRDKIKQDVLDRVRSSIGEIMNIVDVSITNIDLSDQLEQAIEQKVVREQEALAKQYELEKEKRQAEITLVRAEAEAKSVKVKGEAIKLSPEVIQLEIAQRWDGKAPLSVSVGNAGANVLLPIGK